MYYVRDSETELQRTVLLLDEMKVKDYAKVGLNLISRTGKSMENR
jgi:hypothetical protein